MNIEDKIAFAKQVYTKIGEDVSNTTFDSIRYNNIEADLIYISDNTKGSIGLIINDKGEYLLCSSEFGVNYWKDEFKNGKRDIFM